MKIHYYANGGCSNHGCEAIYRSLVSLLSGNEHIIHSFSIEEDTSYGLDNIATLKPLNQMVSPFGISNLLYKLQLKFQRNDIPYFKRAYKNFLHEASPNDLYLSVGGDNYCYSSYDWLSFLNDKLTAKGCKTVLAGCSIEPKSLTPKLISDLKKYSLIIARESSTHSALNNVGLSNVALLPDPAFSLKTSPVILPANIQQNNTIGINVSPVVMQNDMQNNVTLNNYRHLMRYILEHTNMSVLLVPHVFKKTCNDRIPSEILYREYKETGRVAMVEGTNCCNIKGYISQCRFFIAARTHASIAAYSACIPTIVLGYSIKSIGIATDIFGDYKDFVISSKKLIQEDELTNMFKKMKKNESLIKKHLLGFMPKYIEKCSEYNSILDRVYLTNK